MNRKMSCKRGYKNEYADADNIKIFWIFDIAPSLITMKFLSSVLVVLAIIASANVVIEAKTLDDRAEFPGRYVSPAEQCQDRHYHGFSGVCKTDDLASRCTQLVCAELLRTGKPEPLETGPALDGTYCGDKKICFDGSCIDDPQPPKNPLNIIDYQYDCQRQE